MVELGLSTGSRSHWRTVLSHLTSSPSRFLSKFSWCRKRGKKNIFRRIIFGCSFSAARLRRSVFKLTDFSRGGHEFAYRHGNRRGGAGFETLALTLDGGSPRGVRGCSRHVKYRAHRLTRRNRFVTISSHSFFPTSLAEVGSTLAEPTEDVSTDSRRK